MIDNNKCVLYVYDEHLGLPSIDSKCLQALFILRMIKKHNVDIRNSGFYITPYLPMLECDGQFYTTQGNILRKLEELLNSKHKSNIEKSRIEAYKTLTFQTFEPCVALNFWGNDLNSKYLLKLYGSEKYFPFSLIYLRRMTNHVQDIINRYTQGIPLYEFNTNDIYETLESYLRDISHLLTLNKYLLGNSPSTLDAFVCGYLVPIYALNLPDQSLKMILQKYDSVIKYLKNYLKHYDIKIHQDDTKKSSQNEEGSDRASIGLIATAGFVAFSVMIGYGLLNDLFRFD